MKLFQLHVKQKLPISINEAWEFLSDPKNLKVITPDSMNFQVLSGADRPMFPGQVIQYKVTPIKGFKVTWVTEITHVVDKNYFVDEQRFGPYSLWHHKHFIKEIPNGVEMEDIVDYKLPLGFLGRIMHALFVKKKLEEIFNYREEKLKELFGVYTTN
ncbi:cell division inhibitor [Flavobacteriaceae bacterium R38]|nr:cell division inhibitor [Flavobacteriaceae bacterium R38]